MSGTNVIPGKVRKASTATAVLFNHNGTQGGGSPIIFDRTDGFTITEPLVTQPGLSPQHWEITGFSVSIRIAVAVGALGNVQYWARFGDIWAGILKDMSFPGPLPTLPIWPPAQFPTDLSTFIKLWNGAEDTINIVNSNTNQPSNYSLISATTVLSFPITVQPGSQLSFAVIMSPSIMESILSIWVSDIDFSVNYNVHQGG